MLTFQAVTIALRAPLATMRLMPTQPSYRALNVTDVMRSRDHPDQRIDRMLKASVELVGAIGLLEA